MQNEYEFQQKELMAVLDHVLLLHVLDLDHLAMSQMSHLLLILVRKMYMN